jgi:hypothetical protein
MLVQNKSRVAESMCDSEQLIDVNESPVRGLRFCILPTCRGQLYLSRNQSQAKHYLCGSLCSKQRSLTC